MIIIIIKSLISGRIVPITGRIQGIMGLKSDGVSGSIRNLARG